MSGRSKILHKFYFDRQDRELLSLVDRTLNLKKSQNKSRRILYNSLLHPHGIFEMAGAHVERMALAVVNLLGSLETGEAKERLLALQSLYNEAMHAAQTTFRYNTARVLIQIMKEIVRAEEDSLHRLMLIRNFRQASSGNPRIVRKFLKKYHLLEMPESKNQLAMDHHVHDSSTKGRKNPTHLIMDAWIKGLRFLTVIYYNYASKEIVQELFEAAKIMRISVRIGIEFRIPFHSRAISIIWEPTGLVDKASAINFLSDPGVEALLQEGREASKWMTNQVLSALHTWNKLRRPQINEKLKLDIPCLEEQEFLNFVGRGQASFLHLAEALHRLALPCLKNRYLALEQEANALEISILASNCYGKKKYTYQEEKKIRDDNSKERLKELHEDMRLLNALTVESIRHTWLGEYDKAILYPDNNLNAPEILHLKAHELLGRLNLIYVNSNARLNLAGLLPEDVLELLWDCEGKITHLEIFNLKEWQEGRTPHLSEINRIQQAINENETLRLKQIIIDLLQKNYNQGGSIKRKEKLQKIIANIAKLKAPYLAKPLRSRIGTDSTSNSSLRHGMGLVLPESLPGHVRRQILSFARDNGNSSQNVPVRIAIFSRISFLENPYPSLWTKCGALIRRLTGWSSPGRHQKQEWVTYANNTAKIKEPGNIITLGGTGERNDNGFIRPKKSNVLIPGFSYINNNLLNALKVGAGFIAATLTFIYTQDWPFLACFGAVIWFFITAVRNVLQAIMSGRGLSRNSLLGWKDHVNTTRICDSLMFTGFSVPLLEYIVRIILLENMLGITVINNPVIVFTIMSFINGIYIAWHNLYRGFPIAAITGNIFRSVLAIPCAILYHDILIIILQFFGIINPIEYLNLGAAIISKAASDTVAAIIEGFADKSNNLRLRYWDYMTKLSNVIETSSKVEDMFPADDLTILNNSEKMLHLMKGENKNLALSMIVNALDLLYFWYYQPQSQRAFSMILRLSTEEERLIILRSQMVLTQEHIISKLLSRGLLGKNFNRALNFYLNYYKTYLRAMNFMLGPDGNRNSVATSDRENLSEDFGSYFSTRYRD